MLNHRIESLRFKMCVLVVVVVAIALFVVHLKFYNIQAQRNTERLPLLSLYFVTLY